MERRRHARMEAKAPVINWLTSPCYAHTVQAAFECEVDLQWEVATEALQLKHKWDSSAVQTNGDVWGVYSNICTQKYSINRPQSRLWIGIGTRKSYKVNFFV